MTEVMFHEHQWARLATLATGDAEVVWWFCPVCNALMAKMCDVE